MVSFHVVQKTLGLWLHATPSSHTAASLAQLALLLWVLVPLAPPRVQAFGVCRSSFRCLNNGTERYGQSIWGPCRCRCHEGFTGPRCQYREASVGGQTWNSLNVLSEFLHRRLEAEQQEREEQQEQLEEREEREEREEE